MKTNFQILQEVEKEVQRFVEKLDLALEEQSTSDYSNRRYAAAKRAALDLKVELTKLTQDSKYRQT